MKLLNLLYPPKCAFCRCLVPNERQLCTECAKTLPTPPFDRQLRDLAGLDECLYPLYYTESVRESLHRYKFHGAAAYARIYGELMADCLQQHGVSADLVSWIPLSRRRLRRRGYDQAELLAREVAKRCELPCECLLRKIRHNPAQSGVQNAEARRQNVKGVYHAERKLSGERILLIDDIITTGSTMQEAAAQLRNAGAGQIVGLSVAGTTVESNGDRDYADI